MKIVKNVPNIDEIALLTFAEYGTKENLLEQRHHLASSRESLSSHGGRDTAILNCCKELSPTAASCEFFVYLYFCSARPFPRQLLEGFQLNQEKKE